jgi:hypothetical protein
MFVNFLPERLCFFIALVVGILKSIPQAAKSSSQ